MITIDKKTIYNISIAVVGLLLIGVFSGYVFCIRTNISDNGNGAGQVGSDIQSAGQQQSAAIDGITAIENGLDTSAPEVGRISTGISESAKSIEEVENRIDANQDKLKSSSELIAESKRILETVRERGKIGN